MSNRDDLSRALPEMPPPRPAQRRAAIDAAMARFDGHMLPETAGAALSHAGPSRRWPQLSALAAMALAGVVSFSLWNEGDPRESPLPSGPASEQAVNASVADRPTPAPRKIAEAEAVMTPAAPSTKSAPERAARAPAAPDAPRDAEDAAPPPAAVYAPAPPPPPAAAPPARATAQATMDSVVAEDVGARPGAEGIVVTGARTRSEAPPRSWSAARAPKADAAANRGDWNACTIGDPARSLAACRTVVDPAASGTQGRANAHIADGLRHAWAGDAGGATAAFDRAIALSGRSSLAFLNRGLARERDGDMRGALADLNKAVRLSPASARAYYHRSLVRERTGDSSGARADAKRALALDPAYRAVVH